MKHQEITINFTDNGLKVKIGCMELVYQRKDFKQFFGDLENYSKDPTKTEKAIRKRWGIKNEPQFNLGGTVTTWGYNDETKT